MSSSRALNRRGARFWCALVIGLVLFSGFGRPVAAQGPGDVNLNGLPYELADLDLFGQYFLHGGSVFTIDSVVQIFATDVTQDSMPLSMLDYMYLTRVVAGLAQPPMGPIAASPYHMVVVQDSDARTIRYLGRDSLAALALLFSGSATFQFAHDTVAFDLSSAYDGHFTRLLIHPRLSAAPDAPLFGIGGAISYTGAGTLVSASCGDYTDTDFQCAINAGPEDSTEVQVRVGSASGVSLGAAVNIPILLSRYTDLPRFGGFELALSFDSRYLTLTDVTAGSLLTQCGWEYFTHRISEGVFCGGDTCSERALRLVALADINNGDHHPTCYGDTSGGLAVLAFQVTADSQYECIAAPIAFVWDDCSANAFAGVSGDSLYLSRRVLDPWGSNVTGESGFPSWQGAPSSCLSTTVFRGIDYYSGHIDINCSDSIDSRGDLNLNGLSYEIADVVTFTNYFYHGLTAFTVNVQQQIAASDVNADGVPLRVSDLEYLYRIIIGDAFPFPKQAADSPAVAVFVQDTVAQTIALSYPDTLGAMYLIFDGEIHATDTLVGELGIVSVADSGLTKVLIAPRFLPDSPFISIDHVGAGLLFHYTGAGHLIYVDATNDGTQITPTAIQGSTGICCGHRGNVEGWSDPSGTVDIADLSVLVDYLFMPAFETAPDCRGEADTNDDSAVDIGDVTTLVDFLFSGVPLPPCH